MPRAFALLHLGVVLRANFLALGMGFRGEHACVVFDSVGRRHQLAAVQRAAPLDGGIARGLARLRAGDFPGSPILPPGR
ncbi:MULTISPECIES: hypothetical protein [Burkholderia cepacia complex]|uniref:DNA-binding response regulator n=2 Tax=Burkholderia cepacia complex TaxID=87882 RepID=A0A6P2JV37_9BURK|nr:MULTISPECIES: hypothetical protein [Burkholderia cepacia complex]AIO72024.1 response regulator [Burkholderia multivorans]MDI3302191.1 hypothetical protein [Burkholderia multivorans]MDN8047013.1 hypothetical protein [Burkholderia multivorans]MDN8052493.1 hypothetical protein [Burkholderia multivorans]MDR8783161.1 hypothetical protein [Burkholderia multivorans]